MLVAVVDRQPAAHRDYYPPRPVVANSLFLLRNYLFPKRTAAQRSCRVVASMPSGRCRTIKSAFLFGRQKCTTFTQQKQGKNSIISIFCHQR